MAGQPIIFPTSSQPSVNAVENGGRLINAFAEKAPDGSRSAAIIRRAPGLTNILGIGTADYRGSIEVNGTLYIANGSAVYSITLAAGVYTITTLSGALPGSGRVMMARNMNASPQIIILHSAGYSKIISGVVSDFSDPDLPASTSICFKDGYLFFGVPAGQCFATAINDITVDALDFATAEAAPDGLVRVVATENDLLMMGGDTIEFWSDAGNATGFPFSRGPVIPVGLFGVRAVAGQDYGFTSDLCLVGNDRRIYRLTGYTATPISRPVDEELLQAISDPDDLEASVYSVNGHSCWVLTSPTWTIVYDLSTGEWHERASIGNTRWRAQDGINAFDTWLAFERGSNEVYRIDPLARRENGEQLVWEVRSAQSHRFPGRFVVNRASFDMVTGVGMDRGVTPIETDPMVSISWSDDGGRTFGMPVLRRLGPQGKQVGIDVFRAGLTGRNGRQWRLQVSDPVEVSLMGGAMDVEPRAA